MPTAADHDSDDGWLGLFSVRDRVVPLRYFHHAPFLETNQVNNEYLLGASAIFHVKVLLRRVGPAVMLQHYLVSQKKTPAPSPV